MVVRVRVGSFRQRLLRWTADLMIVAGASALMFWGWGVGKGVFYQWVQGAQFATEVPDGGASGTRENQPPASPSASSPFPTPLASSPFQTPLASAPSRWGPVKPFLPALAAKFPRDPLLIGRLEAPEIGLAVMVREGSDEETLMKAAGHLPGTALPGETGNFVVLGHRDTFFRALRNVQRGNSMSVQTRTERFTYIVDSFEVTGPESIGLERTPQPGATLVTRFPFTYIGPAPKRFVVRARLADSFAAVGP